MAELPDLTPHQPALERIAADGFPAWLRRVLDPHDLVQQTLLEACRTPDRLAGLTAAQQFGYLRAALRNNLTDALRKHGPMRTEVSAELVADSSLRLGEYLASDVSTPSARADRTEWTARLLSVVNDLPDAQRVAVEMRYLRGLPVGDIARELDRTPGAVSLLLHRALASLRRILADPRA